MGAVVRGHAEEREEAIEVHEELVEELVGGRVDEDVEHDVQQPGEREHRGEQAHAEEEAVLERVAAALLVRHLAREGTEGGGLRRGQLVGVQGRGQAAGRG